MIVLDTSALIDLFRGNETVRGLIGSDLAVTAVSYHEIFSGIKHRRARAEEKFFRRFFSGVPVLDLDIAAAQRSSEIAARLLSLGTPVNAFDVLIAGIAISNGAEKLVTRDKDFEIIGKVADLRIELY